MPIISVPVRKSNLGSDNDYYTVDSRYLEVEGTLWNTSRYPYFDISVFFFQNWGKFQMAQPFTNEYVIRLD